MANRDYNPSTEFPPEPLSGVPAGVITAVVLPSC
jgi:hypothetical protein